MTPGVTKKRLALAMLGRYEVGVSLDLRDAWVGLYWRRERYSAGTWVRLWEFYVCPVPFLVFSLRFP